MNALLGGSARPIALRWAPLRVPLILTGAQAAPELARRLGALGLRPGARLELLQKTSGGGRVLSVAGARIALDRGVLALLEAHPEAEPK